MNNQQEETILTLKIPRELKKELDILNIRYEKTLEELLIPVLKEYVTSKNTKSTYTEGELDTLVDDLNRTFTNEIQEKKKLNKEDLLDLFNDDKFWDN